MVCNVQYLTVVNFTNYTQGQEENGKEETFLTDFRL